MIGIGFAERLFGGYHRPRGLSHDRVFSLDLLARPVTQAPMCRTREWRVSGTLQAATLIRDDTVQGSIHRDGARLVYELRVESGSRNLSILGEKQLFLRDLYASLSMFRGTLREGDETIAIIRARVDLRSDWRHCFHNLRLFA